MLYLSNSRTTTVNTTLNNFYGWYDGSVFQQVMVPIPKSEDLILIPKTHLVKGQR